MKEGYITNAEAASLLKISPKTLRNWDKSGKLKPHHIDENNGYRYYTRKQIHDFNKMRYEESSNTENVESELPTSQNVIENESDVSNMLLMLKYLIHHNRLNI